ncbi:TetR/AcrR family transcriptional regulator [uncultured Williamsia sp.]|uniref:TetR/AcrR family transcriptional regulator n=1 Tax=uncultured Williamsia sp. TaxID=259311 RepID=UPI00263037A7|nr:TetR/AcrR family transcriptional regulator [uncultured Williamsia sp.]
MNRHAEVSAETRARLIAAAWDLLAEGGTRAATVQAVAQRSRISRGSIGWHFGSKEGLVVAVVNDAFDMLCERVDAVFDAPGPATWERALGAQNAMLADSRFRIFATVGLDAIGEQGAVAAAFTAGHQRVRDLYAHYLSANDLVGDEVDPQDVATALRAMTLGLNIQRRFDPDVIGLTRAVGALRAARTVEGKASEVDN